MTRHIEIVLLAAGAARRMKGGDKTLETVGGQPLLRHLAKECLTSKARQTHVVVPTNRPRRAKVLQDLDVNVVEAKDADLGMSASIKAGIRAAQLADAALILLADMPNITGAHLDRMIQTYLDNPDRTILRAVNSDQTPGHPVLFGRTHFEALEELSGDAGAKELLKKSDVLAVPLDGSAATTDLDTPEDWAAWRSSGQSS